MCLAIPMELLEAAGDEGVVSRGGLRQRVSLALLPEAAPGDYVLVHAGYAIATVDRAEAEETRRLLAELLDVEEGAAPDADPARGPDEGETGGEAP